MGIMVIGIDPGTVQSGWCLFDGQRVLNSGVESNAGILNLVCSAHTYPLAVEMVASYGMPVGREVFETVRWIGRFQQAYPAPERVQLIYRRDVKLHLCGTVRAKDANVWQALVDKLGPVGTKASPGPLYGVKSHARSAVAVAVLAVHNLEQMKGIA